MADFRLPDRAVLALEGPDTLHLLERVVTLATADWPAGEARYGALLTPQGKVIADFIALRTPEGVWLDVPRAARADLEKRMALYRLRASVGIAARDDLCVCLDADGFADPRGAGLPRRAMVAAGPDLPDAQAWETARIACGVAEWGRDFGPAEVFPADINMDFLNGVDFRKGCFIGQEVVSRMKRRGTARRRTLALAFDGPAPQAGTPVLAGTDEVGSVTSTAGTMALARLRIDRLAKAGEAPLSAAGQPARLIAPEWLAAEMAALSGESEATL